VYAGSLVRRGKFRFTQARSVLSALQFLAPFWPPSPFEVAGWLTPAILASAVGASPAPLPSAAQADVGSPGFPTTGVPIAWPDK